MKEEEEEKEKEEEKNKTNIIEIFKFGLLDLVKI